MSGKKSGSARKGSQGRASSAQSERVYKDNDFNRRLGRAGMPLGSAVHNKSTGAITNKLVTSDYSGQCHTQFSNHSNNGVFTKSAVNQNEAPSFQPGKGYKDNALNRRLGRVGMPLGSAVYDQTTGKLKNKLGTGSDHFTHSHTQSGQSFNWESNDVTTKSAGSQSDAPTFQPGKGYKDNALNRSLGRVGMPLGSAVHDQTTGKLKNKLGTGSDHFTHSHTQSGQSFNRESNDVTTKSAGNQSDAPTFQPGKGYKDNALNRSLGRVGMPLGSAVYDQATGKLKNKLGTGSDHFTHSHTQSGQSFNWESNDVTTKSAGNQSDAPTFQPGKGYKDNALNRSLGRVGMPLGSAVYDKTTGKFKNKLDTSSDKFVHSTTNLEKHPGLDVRLQNEQQTNPVQSEKVYKDNPQNRRLGRIGMPIGTAVFDKKSGILSRKQYVDNPLNRKLNRVGLPRGSLPHKKKSVTTDLVRRLIYDMEDEDETSFDGDYRDEIQSVRSHDEDNNSAIQTHYKDQSVNNYAKEQALCHRNRKEEEENWLLDQKADLKTRSEILLYNGTEILYKDITIGKQIGNGGFGEVYFANWQGSVVAVKKLRAGTISNRSIRKFEEEMKKCCRFQHENIVKFIGACLERPNLCIVMEYMQMCLFHAIHVVEVDFTENQRISIIQQVTKGLRYLHGMKTAHCDLKSHNILMNIQDDGTSIAKISDFGLSMIKAYSQSSAYVTAVQHVGTPRYSAPEVLRGEFLETSAMMTADIYSLSLVYLEIIYQEEPFCEFTYLQLQQQVGKNGVKPKAQEDLVLGKNILGNILLGCSFNPEERPSITELDTFWQEVKCLYID